MSPETIVAIVTALGIREIGGQLVAAWHGRHAERRADFEEIADTLQADNRDLRAEVRDAKSEARRANRRIDWMLSRIITCEHGASCPAGAWIDDELVPVKVGQGD
jgi:hypothetical protein